jgi:hypothetical protein
LESKDAKPQGYVGQATSGSAITEELTISTLGERDIIEDKLVGQRPLGLWADTWRRLKRNRLAVVGLGIIVVFMIVGMSQVVANVAGWQLSPYDPNEVNYALTPTGHGSPPSWSHLFGTDSLGRDLFSRVLVATRISLLVGVIAVAIALVIGLILGPISGYYGGWVDTVIMRTADIFFAFPYILFVLLIMTVLGQGFVNVSSPSASWDGPAMPASTVAPCSASSPWSSSRPPGPGRQRPARCVPPRPAQHHGAGLRRRRHGCGRRHRH